ncbi:phosphoribosylformylglycinamidine synthase isoform X2 [Hyalella azteca]|uniref:phosphoribosylformylglycinamidine synthase n=1 Tax=Hyalella azteca TaxID=294128 RepID=A0A8B7NTS9_HYAAZ|nr:phosphoribosylformylglycinamidine synthase isoform X2 [Hyalella azteca]
MDESDSLDMKDSDLLSLRDVKLDFLLRKDEGFTSSARQDQGIRMKDQGSRMKDQGSRMKDQGSRMQDQGSRMKSVGNGYDEGAVVKACQSYAFPNQLEDIEDESALPGVVLEEGNPEYIPVMHERGTKMTDMTSEAAPTAARDAKPPPPLLRWFGEAVDCQETCDKLGANVAAVRRQPCYYIQLKWKDRFHRMPLVYRQQQGKTFLKQLLGEGAVGCEDSVEATEDLQVDHLLLEPLCPRTQFIVEIGPKLRHRTPWCVQVLSICAAARVPVQRIERTVRYLVTAAHPAPDIAALRQKVTDLLHDPVLEDVYEAPLESFFDESPSCEYLWEEVPLLSVGRTLLKQISDEHALGFDEADIDFYYNLYENELGRNPTMPELCDLAQSNSEHSRHWFFKGRYLLEDGNLEDYSLMEMVMVTNGPTTTNQNNVIKFNDNSSAIAGFRVTSVAPQDPRKMSAFECHDAVRHLLLTAETHNFPTGVAPFSGSATGAGGRIRDVMAAGRGGYVLAATAGYCVGQLNLPDNKLPWEANKDHVGYFEPALKIIIEASNGASDYGNKFGEPVTSGFFRAFGGALGNEWREWLKPIMFSAGVGLLDERHVHKYKPSNDDDDPPHIAKIGGPAYRIGIGGGAASSVEVQGASGNRTKNAVQRGDPEMGNKLNRFVRACIEMGDDNPILSIHDQGAGGNANVLKEIVEGQGADIHAPAFSVGDSTLTLEELWCAEYQESNAILFRTSSQGDLGAIAMRERCKIDDVGTLRNDGRFRLLHTQSYEMPTGESLPVDFPLQTVMQGLPRKTYKWSAERQEAAPLELPDDLRAEDAVERVLKLPSVASKRFLTSKVDRSVTGQVAQQQCVGQHQLPLADVAVTACSFFQHEGVATSTGEQPVVTTVNPAAGARLSLMEALAGLCMAPITTFKDIKCSVNWMWPAKLKGEGYAMYVACSSLCSLMVHLGVAVDGGKDSLGMAAQTLDDHGQAKEVVKAPGTVVVTAYAPCVDITKVVTPDLKGSKRREETRLLWVRPTRTLRARVGGSALAQVYGGLGCETPDFTIEDAAVFVKAFGIIQALIAEGLILSGHDVSEGGLVTCLAEMMFASTCGLDILLPPTPEQDAFCYKSRDHVHPNLAALFAEEIGWVLEVHYNTRLEVIKRFEDVPCFEIGGPTIAPGDRDRFVIRGGADKRVLLLTEVSVLRDAWESTSLELELYQTNAACARQEYDALSNERTFEPYKINFNYRPRLSVEAMRRAAALDARTPKVAVVREEGCNGDREMAAAFMMAGFLVFDVTMTDITACNFDLMQFRGIAFPGGFSFGDVLGAGVGWAACIKGNEETWEMFQHWRHHPRNFSLAVCNGCQLTAQLGWQNSNAGHSLVVGGAARPDHLFRTNLSGRFESRWSRVRIEKTKNIFLKEMEDSILGVWVAHKEGRFEARGDVKVEDYFTKNLVAIRYVGDDDEPTETYPMNPNGSPMGIAGISSPCGRHLALMPHPERCVLPWQWPYRGHFPEKTMTSQPEGPELTDTAPWAKIFQNAFDWCTNDPSSYDTDSS